MRVEVELVKEDRIVYVQVIVVALHPENFAVNADNEALFAGFRNGVFEHDIFICVI